MTAQQPLSRAEFVALIATLFAIIAFSIDAMLPAIPEIASTLTPDAPNRAQLIVTSFVFGMGAGTLFAGPLSDTLGRKPVIVGGALLYCGGAFLAHQAPTLETLLAARVPRPTSSRRRDTTARTTPRPTRSSPSCEQGS